LVGRTGGGKSTVARVFAAQGAVVIEGDALGHYVTDCDPEVREALIAEYGDRIYRADGTLDRPRVADRVFSDPEARARLDRLVHPRIVGLIRDRLDDLRANAFRGVAVIDAALLLEWELERECDAVIAVVAPESERVARLMRARGWTREEVELRLAAQRSDAAFAAAADVTVENRGTAIELVRAARGALARLGAKTGPRGRHDREERC
jgi:dephospho-CoA kinase